MKQIKDFPNYLISKEGQVFSILKNTFIAKKKHPKGYLFVRLSNNGFVTHKTLNRLVAFAYLPNPENKPQVNHINGIKTDNRIENLEWSTASQNVQCFYDLQKDNFESNLVTKKSKIIIDLNTGIFYSSIAELSKLLNINYQTMVSKIKTNRSNFIIA